MHQDRATALIALLSLRAHPEGGHYREVHRPPDSVQPTDGRSLRPALTTIYFLLAAGEMSRWHRVLSDESWHYHEGAPLELIVTAPDFETIATYLVGPFEEGAATEPMGVVSAGWWQAARSTGPYTLVSCCVGPGFVFDDFVMLRDLPDDAARLSHAHPSLASLV